ncbi:MAG: hypothetical protein SVK08_00265 [Halobacteriota archaeon]|nr:hypothetical protein [Halobacteriota archaeon]
MKNDEVFTMKFRLIDPSNMKASEFNERFPKGTRVRYQKDPTGIPFLDTQINEEAWDLGCGKTVVKICGMIGAVDVKNLKIYQMEE